MICPHCGKEHPDAALFCPETGKTIAGKSICPHCGQVHPAGAQFCPVTGDRIVAIGEPQGTIPVRKTNRFFTFALPIFLVLCLAIGAVGAFAAGNLSLDVIPFLKNILPMVPSSTPRTELTVSTTEPTKPIQPTRTPSPTDLPTLIPTSTPRPTFIPSPTLDPDHPIGKIVYTCQLFGDNDRNQICIINADGTNQRRLTTDDQANHFYPSLSPDGQSIVFSSSQTGAHEIYEMDLDGNQTRLTSMGELYAPEISPDGLSIVFTNAGGLTSAIWIMDRDGSNPREVYRRNGADTLDPTWSPDGEKILFAVGSSVDERKLYIVNKDGTNPVSVNDDFTTRGRSDWSWSGDQIAGYSGGRWERKIYIMNTNGSNLTELFSTGNVQAPSFSPDNQWLTFTGYIDKMGDENGCEIYLLRLTGEPLKRLTNNDFCDWQPRWGP